MNKKTRNREQNITKKNKEKPRTEKNQHFAKNFLEMTNMEKNIAKRCQYRMKT